MPRKCSVSIPDNYTIREIPQYDGMGVYALVDENGKAYIGSSIHIKSRIKEHQTAFYHGWTSIAIESALKDGRTFHCEILAMINTEVSKHELEEMERIFLNRFGGIEKTYNCRPLEHKI